MRTFTNQPHESAFTVQVHSDGKLFGFHVLAASRNAALHEVCDLIEMAPRIKQKGYSATVDCRNGGAA